MPLLILNLSCENVKYPARKHFEKTNSLKYIIMHSCVNYRENLYTSNDSPFGFCTPEAVTRIFLQVMCPG